MFLSEEEGNGGYTMLQHEPHALHNVARFAEHCQHQVDRSSCGGSGVAPCGGVPWPARI
jgi:hypothetical protein